MLFGNAYFSLDFDLEGGAYIPKPIALVKLMISSFMLETGVESLFFLRFYKTSAMEEVRELGLAS